jgi:glutamyl-tRNA synthetase
MIYFRVQVEIIDKIENASKKVPKHKKNLELGEKVTYYEKDIMLEQIDAAALEDGEEITLMDWGNAFVRKIIWKGNLVTKVELELNLNGDFKKTKKKLTWLALGACEKSKPVELILQDYDYLITKKKLEEDDKFEDHLNTVTISEVDCLGDSNLRELKVGDIIQLERKGYFICDESLATKDKIVLISIPDGKAESVSLKNFSNSSSQETNTKTTKVEMYGIPSVYQSSDVVLDNKMYKIKSVYSS